MIIYEILKLNLVGDKAVNTAKYNFSLYACYAPNCRVIYLYHHKLERYITLIAESFVYQGIIVNKNRLNLSTFLMKKIILMII